MKTAGMGGMIITGADPHLSEYAPKAYRYREYFSGFTGSAGILVITHNKAGLWTDFRYWIQADLELDSHEIELFKEGQSGTIPFLNWLSSELDEGVKIGVDGSTLSFELAQKWSTYLNEHRRSLVDLGPLPDNLWPQRPPLPQSNVYTLPLHLSGLGRVKKIEQVRELLSLHQCESTFISSLDDIAWLLNMRGMDLPMTPVVRSYCWVDQERVRLFIDQSRLGPGVIQELQDSSVELCPYQDFSSHLRKKGRGKTYFSPQKTNWLAGAILTEGSHLKGQEITTLLKSQKNPVEIDCFHKAMVEDGAAMVNFSHWLKSHVGREHITEWSAAVKSREFREAQRDFITESFAPIPAYAEHGALCHYSAESEQSTPLKAEGLFLFDSGGQYLGATTDVTRTYSLGTPTGTEKEDYTLVLKGHIALSRAIFPEGTRGYQLDVLARTSLWEKGLDYGHGTGHGVGAFLNVHEGPHSISSRPLDRPILSGTVTSNEPGLYREGVHGIRIENLILAVKDKETEFGNFLRFETLTLCPYERELIEERLLTEDEIQWVNRYHKRVYDAISPLLSEEVKIWLRLACASL